VDFLTERLRKEGVDPDGSALLRLERFAEMLEEWNRVHNLTGARNREEIGKNIVDSLIPVGFVEAPASLLDVGTGAGFPGLMLAIAWPDTETVLCEPRNKRAAFLRYAALELGLQNVRVEKKRVEKLEKRSFGLISSRAVTDTALLLQLTKNLHDSQTRYLFYKGSRLEEELKETESTLQKTVVTRGQRHYLYLHP